MTTGRHRLADCPTCRPWGRPRLEPHPRLPVLRCSNCKEHLESTEEVQP